MVNTASGRQLGHAPRLFGTDGIRGVFGDPPLDRSSVVRLGEVLAARLESLRRTPRPVVVLGGDPRISSPALEDWLTEGLHSGGVDTISAGVLPTPGIAWLTRHLGADLGIVLSASHNLVPDNGIKLIGNDGFKLSREEETEIEAAFALPPTTPAAEAAGRRTGSPSELQREAYLQRLRESVPANCLEGLRVVLDTGNGAASALARPLFEGLGAQVELLHAEPDGYNINRDCGSTVPEQTAERVRALGFDLGFAFDGDADRMILCDGHGTVRNGDACLYLWACHLAEHNRLPRRRIVVTTMSNLGLERALDERGISVQRCDVGDRQVVEALRAGDLRLGGEQSGHLIDLELATTGDGLLSAVQLSAIVADTATAGGSLRDRLAPLIDYPQLLLNVRVSSKPPFDQLPAVQRLAEQIQGDLGAEGRLVLRYSGTEPVARVMVEAATADLVQDAAHQLADCLRKELG